MANSHWAYDLHIHSALSPCGDSDMTPNNIINMAILKGLDIISVTDHNSGKNLPAIFEAAKDKEIIVLPGIEVNTIEEVHLLCYFPTLESVMDFDKYIEKRLAPIQNIKEIFGQQLILNSNDELIGEEEKFLLNTLNLSIEKIFTIVKEREGTVVPAHIDRKSFSIISNLGFLPPDLPIKTLELSYNLKGENFKDWKERYRDYQIIQSSDAHILEDILERVNFIPINSPNIQNIIKFLNMS